MEDNKFAFGETLSLLPGQLLCTGAMVLLFALFGRLDASVFLGSIAGTLIATANFYFLTFFAALSARKAAARDVDGGRMLIRLSCLGRMAGLFLALVLCAGSGYFFLPALVIPRGFTGPIVALQEILKGKEAPRHGSAR